MVFTLKDSIVGAGRLFLKSFSNKLPALLTAIPGNSAGNKLRRTVRPGWLAGLRLLLVPCGELPEVRRCVSLFVRALIRCPLCASIQLVRCTFWLKLFNAMLVFVGFLSGAGRFAANLPGDRLLSNLDFVARDFLSFSGFMKPTGCSAGVLLVPTVFGMANSPKVISALPHWFIVLSSQSTIGSALPFFSFSFLSVALQ